MALIAQSCTIVAFTPRFAWSIKGNGVHRILICCSVSEMYKLSIRIYTLIKIFLTQDMKNCFVEKALTMTKFKPFSYYFTITIIIKKNNNGTVSSMGFFGGTASQVVE